MVGRVDMFNMPGNGAPTPWPSELELLRNYLNKDHNWRFGLINVQKRALVADRFGNDDGGEPKASSGYRNFDSLLGHDKMVWADCWKTSTSQNRWISLITGGGKEHMGSRIESEDRALNVGGHWPAVRNTDRQNSQTEIQTAFDLP